MSEQEAAELHPHHAIHEIRRLRARLREALEKIQQIAGASNGGEQSAELKAWAAEELQKETFPAGSLGPDDEGASAFVVAVSPDRKTVIMEFEKPTAWMGFAKSDLRRLIATLTLAWGEMVDR